VSEDKRSPHPIGTPTRALSPNTGPLAAAAWLVARGLLPTSQRWHVEITLPADVGSFRLEVYAEEWGFHVAIADRASWIRVTDLPFVHGRDDHHLLDAVPPLKDIGKLIRTLEQQHAVKFDRTAAKIETSVADAEPAVRAWLATI
jgi:hypothetical protein